MRNIINTPSLVNLERLELSVDTSVNIDVQEWMPVAAHLRHLKELKIVSSITLPSSKEGACWAPFFTRLSPTLESLEVDVSLGTQQSFEVSQSFLIFVFVDSR